MDATIVYMNTSPSISGSLYNTSLAKIAPAIGAWKMAPTPAPMPLAKSILLFFSVKPNFVAKKEPNPAPIWAIGPSLPPEPPLPNVIAEAIIFIIGTMGFIMPLFL